MLLNNSQHLAATAGSQAAPVSANTITQSSAAIRGTPGLGSGGAVLASAGGVQGRRAYRPLTTASSTTHAGAAQRGGGLHLGKQSSAQDHIRHGSRANQ